MNENQKELERVAQRSLTNDAAQVNTFISDLKIAGANLSLTMKILAEKLGISLSQSKELVFSSPSWNHLDSAHNPFTDEFLKIVAVDAEEINKVDGKIISVKINLDENSKRDDSKRME